MIEHSFAQDNFKDLTIMDDLQLTEHRSFIERLVGRHITARVKLVPSKAELGGKLGQAHWGSPTELPLILHPECITVAEIEQSLFELALRGRVTGNPKLMEHADEIGSSEQYLEHLVLHEVAHIKNNWRQDRETDCDLWVYAEMHGET